MRAERTRQFDPDIFDVFMNQIGAIKAVAMQFMESKEELDCLQEN